MKSRWMLMVAVVAVGAFVTTAVAQDVVVVTVQGEGISKDAAKNDALRRALEQGGQQEISSYSQVENFELIRDTIYSRAEGIITDYKILQEGPGVGGVFYCKIQAKVSKSAIATSWGEVQNVLDQIGRPGIMVMIAEYIDDIADDSSILESKIEERLIKSGFDVYAGAQVREIAKRESADAAVEDNVAKMQAIAKDFETQIFIIGSAHANAAGVKDLYGVKTAMYNCDAAVKMFYTDTGRLIASESEPAWRGGAQAHFTASKQAGKKALSNAGTEIIEKVGHPNLRRRRDPARNRGPQCRPGHQDQEEAGRSRGHRQGALQAHQGAGQIPHRRQDDGRELHRDPGRARMGGSDRDRGRQAQPHPGQERGRIAASWVARVRHRRTRA